jgi:1,4-dihydroxy-2-naphthoyl-CoA hydrolase
VAVIGTVKHPPLAVRHAVDMDLDTDATAFVHESMPMCASLGVAARSMSAAEVVLSLDWAPEWCTVGGALHGGALMTLADSAGAAVAFLNLPEGSIGTSTIESKTNFLGGVTSGTVSAVARPLHVGASTIVVETELTADDRLVAKVTQTQIVLRRPG